MAHSFSRHSADLGRAVGDAGPRALLINIDRQSDAALLCRQVIAAQPATHKVALICSGDKPDRLLAELASPALQKLPLYQLPEKSRADAAERRSDARPAAAKSLTHPAGPRQPVANLHHRRAARVDRTLAAWLRRQGCTLLILSHGGGINKLKGSSARSIAS